LPLRFAALILASLALAGCGAPSPTTGGKPAAAAPEIQWGEAVNGLQAGLTVKSPPAGPEARATLLFTVRNAGQQPVKIMKVDKFGGCGYSAPAMEVKSEGEARRWQGPQPSPLPLRKDFFVDLAPGAADSVEQLFYPELWGLKSPFKAQVGFTFAWDAARIQTHEGTPTFVDGLWTGKARSQPVQIEVAK